MRVRPGFLVLTSLAASAAVFASASAAPEDMSVQVKKTPLRDQPSFLGKILRDLNYGDRVTVVERNAAWIKVQPQAGTPAAAPADGSPAPIGYLHQSALSKKKVVLKADQNAQVMASSEEVALAGKGFNDDVERQYQQQHPNLAAAFATLDQIEKNPTFSPQPQEVNAFRTAGGLGGGAS